MRPGLPDDAHVVIAGGGVAALEALLALRSLAGDRVSIELIAPDTTFSYRPLAVAEPFNLSNVNRLDLERLVHAHGGSFDCATIREIDVEARTVTTSSGAVRSYDALVLAVGARAVEAVPGALTYRGEQDAERLGDVLAALKERRIERLAFVVPPGCSWPLPLYELALMTGGWIRRHGVDAELAIITFEARPLQLFGPEAAEPVRRLLADHGVALRTGSIVESMERGRLWMPFECSVAVDRAIALPRLVGHPPAGLPTDARGFVPVDEFCRVGPAEDHVYAAGDMTDAEIKQGGLATQQADASAEVIAAAAGADIQPEPFRPVLRGLLLTGEQPLYMRRPVSVGAELPAMQHEPLWWPPHKIVGRHLAPFLVTNAAESVPEGLHGLPIEVQPATSAS
jgi:sulfide:quinone oxidoreductase